VRKHLLEEMRITALHHTAMGGGLAARRPVVSTAMEFKLGWLPNKTFLVEVLDVVVAEFRKHEEQRSRLEWPGARIFDLLLGLASGPARLADLLDKAARQLGVELTA
jgi:hypothetical protein